MNTTNNATLTRNIKVNALPPCHMHPTRPSMARMSYQFAGSTRKNHYNVCQECHQEYSRGETLVSIALYEVRS